MDMNGAGFAAALDRSMVVEASAGTGKTTALVNRIVDVIAAGTPVETIVAVTFTHAAAGNMKLRVRHELEQRRTAELDAAVRDRLAQAARSLDRAFIGTIHAFCAQLLRRRPVEAGVDPVFQELAQPDALRVFSGVFRRWSEQRLAAPSPALVRALARLSWREERDGAEPLDALRTAAWSLAEWRDFDAPWDKRGFDRDARLESLLQHADSTLQLRNRCARQRDPLFEALAPLAELLQRVERMRAAGRFDGDAVENEILRLPHELRWMKHGHGKYGDTVSREVVVASWETLKAAIEEFGGEAGADLAAHLRDELWEVVGLYQSQKKMAGQLDFMDLLLYARDLLQHDGARAQLQQGFHRIFVDEFQDTDPLQAEILLLLAAADPAQRDWRQADSRARQGCTWSAIPSSPSIVSAAPTRASSAESAAASPIRGRGLARPHQQPPQHAQHPGVCERVVRAIDSRLPAAGGRRGRSAAATQRNRAAHAGAVWLPQYLQREDRAVLAGRGGGLHPLALQ